MLFFFVFFLDANYLFATSQSADFSNSGAMKMCNELQHIVPLSAIFAIGQRDASRRILKMPYSVFYSQQGAG